MAVNKKLKNQIKAALIAAVIMVLVDRTGDEVWAVVSDGVVLELLKLAG